MTINQVDLYASLAIMWKGMAGLFAVCGFVMLLIIAIKKISSPKAGKTKD